MVHTRSMGPVETLPAAPKASEVKEAEKLTTVETTVDTVAVDTITAAADAKAPEAAAKSLKERVSEFLSNIGTYISDAFNTVITKIKELINYLFSFVKKAEKAEKEEKKEEVVVTISQEFRAEHEKKFIEAFRKKEHLDEETELSEEQAKIVEDALAKLYTRVEANPDLRIMPATYSSAFVNYKV